MLWTIGCLGVKKFENHYHIGLMIMIFRCFLSEDVKYYNLLDCFKTL